MALKRRALLLPIVAFSFAAPSLCLAGAISINGTCVLGDCSTPDILKYGRMDSQSFSYLYVFPNTDTYRVHGTYTTSDSSQGTTIKFSVLARFIGNSTHTTSSADVVMIDLYQDYHVPFALGGTYSYSQSFRIGEYPAAGSFVETDLYYDGQDVGLIGPFSGMGFHNGSASATLTALSRPLSADYRYTFSFAAGTVADPGPRSDESDLGINGSGSSLQPGGSLQQGDDHE